MASPFQESTQFYDAMRQRQPVLDAQVAEALQAVAINEWKQKQAIDNAARQQKAQQGAMQSLQQLNAPPAGPQAPPPGAPSVPMMQPPAAQPPISLTGQAPPSFSPGLGPNSPGVANMDRSAGIQAPGFVPIPGGGFAPPPPGMGAGGQESGPIPTPPAMPQPTLPANMMDVPRALESMKKAKIPEDQQFDVLEKMLPVMSAQNKTELDKFKATIEAKKAGEAAAKAAFDRVIKERQVGAQEKRAAAYERGVNARTAGGGAEKTTNKEYVYPRKADGTVDESKGPIGTRAMTATGKVVVRDLDGNETTLSALGGGTAKESKDSKVGVTNVVRQGIVKAGVTNSLARLDEIEKEYGDTATSSFFGQHADNPASRAMYGVGKSTQSAKQQKVDAAWASFIDEAIPVFTGGLRGSDSFRKFLIEQAPGPGDKPAAQQEKRRLLRANIQGTSKAFFNKFASDPSFRAPGTKPEDVEVVKQGDKGESKVIDWNALPR
jgi:hypothetical protein